MNPSPLVNTPKWERWRQGGIGTSEIPVLLGLDPYRTEHELALEKRGLIARPAKTQVMGMGHDIEDLIARRYSREKKRTLERVRRSVTSERWPHVFTSPDRTIKDEPGLVEAKWRPGSDTSADPERFEVQALGQMGITSTDFVDIAALDQWGRLDTKTIERREKAVIDLCDMAEDWYVRYVLGDEMPEPDGSAGARRYADALAGEGVMEASGEQDRLMGQLRDARRERDAFATEADRLENLLALSLAGYDECIGEGWRITYKRTRAREKTDWKLVADGLLRQLPEEEAAVLVALHTAVDPGSRPFRPTWSK